MTRKCPGPSRALINDRVGGASPAAPAATASRSRADSNAARVSETISSKMVMTVFDGILIGAAAVVILHGRSEWMVRPAPQRASTTNRSPAEGFFIFAGLLLLGLLGQGLVDADPVGVSGDRVGSAHFGSAVQFATADRALAHRDPFSPPFPCPIGFLDERQSVWGFVGSFPCGWWWWGRPPFRR